MAAPARNPAIYIVGTMDTFQLTLHTRFNCKNMKEHDENSLSMIFTTTCLITDFLSNFIPSNYGLGHIIMIKIPGIPFQQIRTQNFLLLIHEDTQ